MPGFDVGARTDVGRRRSNNEDNFNVEPELGLFVLSDGMGGEAAGEVASKLAVETISGCLRDAVLNNKKFVLGDPNPQFSDATNELASAIRLSNQAIWEAAQKQGSHHGMGTTVVSAWLHGAIMSIAHVGDSRIYRIRNAQIEQMTEDHSLVAEQVRRGLISQEEADRSDIQNIIFRALGADATVEPDLEDLVAQPGDILLLATDGLTKYIKELRLLEIIESSSSLGQACDRLIQAAKEAGGDDNVTCVLMRIIKEPWYRRWFGGGHKWQSST